MAASAYTVTIEGRTRLARWVAGACLLLWPVLGRERAKRWAWTAILRFSRFRIARGGPR